MIRPLLAELDLPQAFVRVMRSLIDRLPQQLRRHEVRAGAGREKAAVFNKPQPFGVDFTVAVRGCLDGIPGLCKSGRIENHNVILTAFPYLFGKKIEDVAGHISDFILQTVQRRVLARLRDRKLRSVNRGDMRCSCCCRVQTKRTGMGKTSRTSAAPLQMPRIARRLNFWSRKKPVFCPSFTSTIYLMPFSVIGTFVSNSSER